MKTKNNFKLTIKEIKDILIPMIEDGEDIKIDFKNDKEKILEEILSGKYNNYINLYKKNYIKVAEDETVVSKDYIRLNDEMARMDENYIEYLEYENYRLEGYFDFL